MSRVLVTGGCGFIGSHLVNRLAMNGNEPVVVDCLSGVGAPQRRQKLLRLPATVWPTTVYEFTNEYNGGEGVFDAIFHLAAVSRTVPAIENPYACMNSNVMGTVAVLELARELKIPRVIVSSSNVVYASDTPYKASKLMMEEACKAYHTTYGVSVVCLRYSNVYGPGFAKGDPACLAAMRDSLIDKGYLEITGDGEQTRDFTHVEDIVQGNLFAWRSDYCGTVDLCTGMNVSMNRASELLYAHAPPAHRAILGWQRGIPDRQGDCKHIAQDPKPAADILGWKREIKFEDGVKDVWRF